MQYSKNDILSFQLKYKNDHDVLDLIGTVDELQDNQAEMDDLRQEVRDLERDLEYHRDRANNLDVECDKLTAKIEELEKQLAEKETP